MNIKKLILRSIKNKSIIKVNINDIDLDDLIDTANNIGYDCEFSDNLELIDVWGYKDSNIKSLEPEWQLYLMKD